MTRSRDLADSADKDISGTVTLDDIILSNDMTVADNGKVIFGAGSDLQIYHDGSHSYIDEQGTGSLQLRATNLNIKSAANETYIACVADGQVELYHDNSKKFETTATGVEVTGGVNITSPTNARALKMQNSANNSASQITFLSHDGTEDSFVRNQASTSAVDTLSLGTGGTERMRIDGSGNVGIGTDSPNVHGWTKAVSINVGNSNSAAVELNQNGTKVGSFNIQGDQRVQILNHTANPITFNINATERMRIDSSGNVIAGGTSAQAADAVTLMADGEVTAAGFYFSNNIGSAMNDTGIRRATTSTLVFDTGSTERMRLDASGNLLVGNTSTGLTSDGINLHSNGTLEVRRNISTANSSTVGYISRGSSDGNLLNFYRNTTNIGSVASRGGTTASFVGYPGSGVGAGVAASTNMIIPSNETGAAQDNRINLGSTSTRWKDLYLSGGVYLGGTGSANKLDDYEEGTFTPTSGVPLSAASGVYRKIGALVHIGMKFTMGSSSSGSTAGISSLPFTNVNDNSARAGLVISWNTNGLGAGATFLLGQGTTSGVFYLDGAARTYSQLAGKTFYIGGTYPTAS